MWCRLEGLAAAQWKVMSGNVTHFASLLNHNVITCGLIYVVRDHQFNRRPSSSFLLFLVVQYMDIVLLVCVFQIPFAVPWQEV